MKQKKLGALIGSVCLILVLAAMPFMGACAKPAPAPAPAPTPAPTPTPAPPVEKVVLKASSAWIEAQFAMPSLFHFIDTVKERSGGQLEIEYLGGSEIVPAKELLDAVGRGVVDIAISGASYYSGVVPEGEFPGLPIVWTYDNYLEIYKKEFAEQIDKAHQEKANVKIMAIANIPHFILATTKSRPVTKLEDLKGLKIRGAGGVASIAPDLLGAASVYVPSPEILPAIERGTIDGAFRPISAIVDWTEYDVLNYVVMPHLCGSCSFIYMNLDSFNKLPDDLRKILVESAQETEEWGVSYMKQREAVALFDMYYKYGVQIYWLPPDELKRWNDLVVPGAIDWFIGLTGDSGKKMIDTLMKYAE